LNESPVHALVGHDVYSQKRRQTEEMRKQQKGSEGCRAACNWTTHLYQQQGRHGRTHFTCRSPAPPWYRSTRPTACYR